MAMTGATEDLKITEIIRSAERSGDDVINIPELTGRDLGAARLALSFGFQKEIKSCFG